MSAMDGVVITHETYKLILHIEQLMLNIESKEDRAFHLIFDM